MKLTAQDVTLQAEEDSVFDDNIAYSGAEVADVAKGSELAKNAEVKQSEEITGGVDLFEED